MSDADGWDQNSKLVLHEITRLNGSVDEMDVELKEFREETKLAIQKLEIQNKFKQSIYGMLGGGGLLGLVEIASLLFKE